MLLHVAYNYLKKNGTPLSSLLSPPRWWCASSIRFNKKKMRLLIDVVDE
jgi:hypothetical protein